MRRRPASHAELPWDDDAKAALDASSKSKPVLVRISAAKRLRDAAERTARKPVSTRQRRRSTQPSRGTPHDSRIIGHIARPIRACARCIRRAQTFARTARIVASTSQAQRRSRAFANHARHPRRCQAQERAIEFRLIFTIAFAVFLFTSVIDARFPTWAQRAGDGEIRKSVFEQARAAAHISAAYAFMG